MATQAQIDANRINAQKSTGPRTPEGKANSRRNALKLGLSATALMISGEDPREMAEMARDYYLLCPPANAFQRFHLENIIYCEWMIRRCRRIEAELMNHLMAKDRSVPFEVEAGCAFERDAAGANALHKLHRRMNSLEKSYYRSLRELQASGVRFDGSAPEPEADADPAGEPQAAPEATELPPATPEIGFVLPNSENGASVALQPAEPLHPRRKKGVQKSAHRPEKERSPAELLRSA
jgi:hypothetical protein